MVNFPACRRRRQPYAPIGSLAFLLWMKESGFSQKRSNQSERHIPLLIHCRVAHKDSTHRMKQPKSELQLKRRLNTEITTQTCGIFSLFFYLLNDKNAVSTFPASRLSLPSRIYVFIIITDLGSPSSFNRSVCKLNCLSKQLESRCWVVRLPGGQTLRKDAQVRLATNSLVDLSIR